MKKKDSYYIVTIMPNRDIIFQKYLNEGKYFYCYLADIDGYMTTFKHLAKKFKTESEAKNCAKKFLKICTKIKKNELLIDYYENDELKSITNLK